MYIVGFNGPPSSGKDSIAKTVGDMLIANYNYETFKMSLAGPMRKLGMELLRLNPEDNEAYAKAKSEGHELFTRTFYAGTTHSGPHMERKDLYSTQQDTLRQFIIQLAEQFIRPTYGRDFWARKLMLDAEFIGDDPVILLVPDIGFQEEVAYFEHRLGRANFLLARIERQDCDFSIDSRRSCGATNVVSIQNNATLGWAAQGIIAAMINIGWKLD